MTVRARDLDVVTLLREVDGWPAGTEGTVVREGTETALVEMATEDQVDEHGLPLRNLMDDLVDVLYDALRVDFVHSG